MKTTHYPWIGLICILILSQSAIFAQNIPKVASDTNKLASEVLRSHTRVESQDFNQGMIIDPLQLIQAQLPSLMISRSGNDPNGFFDIRNRGLTSFNNTEPLFLLDGMPVNSLNGIHPQDIASIEILQDGASLGMYGLRASNGILSIKTKRGSTGKAQIHYQSSFSTERHIKTPDVLDARAFVSNGGYDHGAKTDWWEEITRRALSQSHHLSMSGGSTHSTYYASLNFDDINGIAKKSGFDRINGRLSFQQKALEDRMSINVNLSTTSKNKGLIPQDVFRIATETNPTFPIYSEDPEFEPYGGYYSPRLFNIYNPVAVLEQLELEERYENILGSVQAQFQISPSLSAFVQQGYEIDEVSSSFFVPSTSLYQSGFSQEGRADKSQVKRENTYFRSGLNFKKTWNKLQFKASGSYHYQDIVNNQIRLIARDFISDFFSYNNLGAAASTERGESEVLNRKVQREYSRFVGSVDLNYNNTLFLAASLSREGASNLGVNSKWGTFYGITAGVALDDNLHIRSSFSQSGNTPQTSFLTQRIYQQFGRQYYYNGEFLEGFEKIQDANPDLQWEETREFSLGVDFKNLLNDRLDLSLDLYSTQSRNIIQETFVIEDIYPQVKMYDNTGGLNSGGLEFSLKYALMEKPGFQWNIQLLGTRYFPTKLISYTSVDRRYPDFVGYMGGRCDFPLLRMEEGEALGEIWGLLVSENQAVRDGDLNFDDYDGNGLMDETLDRQPVGNAFAKTYVGFHHRLSWNKFVIDARFRGVLGHDIVNHNHSFYSFPNTIGAYNLLESGLTEFRGLDWYAPAFTDRDVENGSFLRLAFLTLNYQLKLPRQSAIKGLNISLSAQNLFTLTGYSGMNPEYRIEDRTDRDHAIPLFGLGDGNANPLAPGMDRRNSYPVTRSFILGLSVDL